MGICPEPGKENTEYRHRQFFNYRCVHKLTFYCMKIGFLQFVCHIVAGHKPYEIGYVARADLTYFNPSNNRTTTLSQKK